MQLFKGDRIKYENRIYKVGAIIWGTVYLEAVANSKDDYKYTMDEVYGSYKDVEILRKKE